MSKYCNVTFTEGILGSSLEFVKNKDVTMMLRTEYGVHEGAIVFLEFTTIRASSLQRITDRLTGGISLTVST